MRLPSRVACLLVGAIVVSTSLAAQVVAASGSTLEFQLAKPLTLTILQSVTSTQ